MVNVTVCERCRSHYFPAKLRCRRCGGTLFAQHPITEGRVVGLTEVLRPSTPHAWTWLVEVEAISNLKLIAVSSSAPVLGDVVDLLQQDDGAIVARVAQPRSG